LNEFSSNEIKFDKGTHESMQSITYYNDHYSRDLLHIQSGLDR